MMKSGVCPHCSESFEREVCQGPIPTYCSRRCKEGAYALRRLQAGRPTQAQEYHAKTYTPKRWQLTCRYCRQDYVASRRDSAQCGEPECRRAYHNHRMRYYNAIRRRLIRNTGEVFFNSLDVFERDGWICWVCKEPIDPELSHPDPRSVSLEHIEPLGQGGSHSAANCSCSHLVCNQRRRKTG